MDQNTLKGVQVAGFILLALGLLIWWQMVYLGRSLSDVWTNLQGRFSLPSNLIEGTPKAT